MTLSGKMELHSENAEVLRSLGYHPDDTLAPRRVDFAIIFPDSASRLDGVARLAEMGIAYELNDGGVSPDCPEATAYAVLQPTAAAITDVEYMLNQSLADFGARTDGWGFFGDTVQ